MKNIPDYFIAFVYVAAISLRYIKARRQFHFPDTWNKKFLSDQVLGIEKISMWVTVMFMIKHTGVTVYSSATCMLTVISIHYSYICCSYMDVVCWQQKRKQPLFVEGIQNDSRHTVSQYRRMVRGNSIFLSKSLMSYRIYYVCFRQNLEKQRQKGLSLTCFR